MRVQDLQHFLSSFTEGSDAVKNAVIFAEVNGTLYDIKRMEVHEHMIIGQASLRLVFRPQDEKKLIIPDKLRKTHYDV